MSWNFADVETDSSKGCFVDDGYNYQKGIHSTLDIMNTLYSEHLEHHFP